MTTAADDATVEEAFEAFLARRPVPGQGASVAAFAEAVRSSASAPGRPNAALADLLANGLLTDQPIRSARTAPRRRRRAAMFFPALLAKIVSAGAVAQAATGAGIVFVAFTGAGVAGALPDSLQHGFATVASTVGIQVEDPQQTDDVAPVPPATSAPTGTEVDGSGTTTDAGDDTAAPATDDGYTLEDWEKGPAEGQPFGDWVSEGARHGYADGAVISREAHEKGIVLPDDTAATTEGSGDDAEQTSAPTAGNQRSGHGNSGSAHGSGGSGSGRSGGHGPGHGDD
ncbi:hypothetical protein [Petropleomorpha daqingensis]|uniref:Uncharacterized protein n=1 Tax=Petropleomorpha daqingensis TaxID=2026353 RepID=A0A853CJE1_9ACTN|nr:hypothetical protein [Petropleomorpha daqingensis]NYJ06093.1 hypothetical protein [Petropleomorpha daqingensis]